MGYHEAPWVFRGRALYQLQLVKVDEARKYVPDDFRLVSLFGYTLGGLYLARYTDSPVGAFDEMVAMAGLVWDFPTSCAWAARVFVNNWDARSHGRQSVGLPSRLASFTEEASSGGGLDSTSQYETSWWTPSQRGAQKAQTKTVLVRNLEKGRWAPWRRAPCKEGLSEPVCFLRLPAELQGWSGPRIQLSLPSFSGGTPDHPGLLKYACDLTTNVRVVPGVWLRCPRAADEDQAPSQESLEGLLSGRPLLTLHFDDMLMRVEKPQRVVLPRPHVLHPLRPAAQLA